MPFQTEFDFTLPNGYQDSNGTLHKEGSIRLATAGDEILAQGDPRAISNPAYIMVIILARVVTRLGTVSMITPKVIESLYTADFSYLVEMYARINKNGTNTIPVTCPKCQHGFSVEVKPLGE
jgi:hypothetical protein